VKPLTVISQKESLRGHPKPGVDSDVSAWSRLSLSPLTDFFFARSRLTLFATRTVSFFAEEHYFFSAVSPVWSCRTVLLVLPRPSIPQSLCLTLLLLIRLSLSSVLFIIHQRLALLLSFSFSYIDTAQPELSRACVRRVRTHNVYACIHTCTRVRYFPVTWASGMP
jgi:hypothetical protein